MGLLNVLFGRNKLKKPNRERFFAIAAAGFALRGRLDLQLSDFAGIVFSPVESSFFDNLDSEIRALLRIGGRATGTRYEVKDDSFGTRWVVLDDRDFEDLVSTIHMIGETIHDHGFGDRLLAAVFKCEYDHRDAYWIYSYKRGVYHPIVLSGNGRRDNAAEMRLGAIMEEEEVPVERNLESWYSLSGIPF